MSDFQILDEPLPGVFVLEFPRHVDTRGDFSKLFHADSFLAQDLCFTPAETFLTRSKSSVIRGMHYQADAAAHEKLVSCVKGRVLDVVVDIQPKSQHFNKPYSINLSEKSNTMLFIGKGYAHGFLSIDDDSWMMYFTSTVHCPSLDKGVLWSSIDFQWPVNSPLVSDRDSNHIPIGMLK